MRALTYRSPKTAVKASPIEGRGLFASAAIAAGEIVAVKGGSPECRGTITGKDWMRKDRRAGSVGRAAHTRAKKRAGAPSVPAIL